MQAAPSPPPSTEAPAPAPTPVASPPSPPPAAVPATSPPSSDGRIFASPFAKKVAGEHGVSLAVSNMLPRGKTTGAPVSRLLLGLDLVDESLLLTLLLQHLKLHQLQVKLLI